MSHADVAIVEPPPEIKFYVEDTARFLSNKGLNMEKIIRTSNKDDPYLSFLKRSDPYHPYYKKILTEYRAKNLNGAPALATDDDDDDDDDDDCEDPPAIRDCPSLPPIFFERFPLAAISDVPSLPPKFVERMEPPQGSHIQVTPPPSMGMMPLPEEKQKLDETTLVPEDKFLDQHSGLSTISVDVLNNKGGKLIEITVQSLSETVGSLKDKLSAVYHNKITTDRLKLIGKTGYLEDSKSLAHYNVGAGEILTLEMVNVVVIQSLEMLFDYLSKKNTV